MLHKYIVYTRSDEVGSARRTRPPANLTSVARAIPPHCFRAKDGRAVRYLALVALSLLVAGAFAALVWSRAWWPLYPIAWAALGTVLTCFFMITHDCGHDAFFRRPLLNQIVGHVAAAPLLYPFHQWKSWHDAHHRHTNLGGQSILTQLRGETTLASDTAFVPETVDGFRAATRDRFARSVYVLSRRCPPIAVAFIPLLLAAFFPLRRARRPARYVASLAVVIAAAVALPSAIVAVTGSVFAVLHFWLLPLAVHACWLGYYAFVQHTGPELPVRTADAWRRVDAQLHGTVNTKVPPWINVLHSNSEFHVVHHISPAIPSYHMREANDALRASQFRELVREAPFSLRNFVKLCRDCQLWDAGSDSYVRFDDLTCSREGETP